MHDAVSSGLGGAVGIAEDPDARRFRLRMARSSLRFLKARMLFEPIERALRTKSDLLIEKTLLFPQLGWTEFQEHRTNWVEKLQGLKQEAGKKFLDLVEPIVPGSRERYQHLLYALLREDVKWTPATIRRRTRQLPFFATDPSRHPTIGGRCVSPAQWQKVITAAESASRDADVLDALALWVILARESSALNDVTPNADIRRHTYACVERFQASFGRELAFVLTEVLVHGPLSNELNPLYFVRSRSHDRITFARHDNFKIA